MKHLFNTALIRSGGSFGEPRRAGICHISQEGGQDHSSGGTPPVQKRLQLLIIDNDSRILNASKRMLSRDHDVKIASNPDDGLNLARQTHFDVIFCDFDMAPGIDGVELTKKLMIVDPANRIILYTGGHPHLTQEKEAEFYAAGGRVILGKPAEPAKIRKAIEEALSKISP